MILERAFDLLQAFGPDRRVMTLSELARAVDLPTSTVHRLARKLVALGALERHGNDYRIGLAVGTLASMTPASAWCDQAMPYLAELQGRTRQTVHMAVLRGGEVVYLEKLRAHGTPATPTVTGGRNPAHCTAVGKVLLADLPERSLAHRLQPPLRPLTRHSYTEPGRLRAELRRIRGSGFAVDREEAAAGLSCVAAPIRSGLGVVAAVSVAFPADTATGGHAVLRPLLEAAAGIGQAIGRDCDPEWLATDR
ncbi:IclR family transcriptional regulator [Nocardia sp. CDC160]|uniref:IclR family transcriptional regulator n=1 Tax=Nocardia sp. CDC160 TaxID=3112166 RepID=UPI002DB7D8D6|nr:IclR family transcriptional regulator [Nocardia sp. CDC160]MEC3917897.1 IclR family transcriptional regulator [Nocardia sp. CDC160]